MTPASRGATIASTVRKWCEGLPECAGNACGRAAEAERVDLSNPLVQAKLKERYGKNIRLRKR